MGTNYTRACSNTVNRWTHQTAWPLAQHGAASGSWGTASSRFGVLSHHPLGRDDQFYLKIARRTHPLPDQVSLMASGNAASHTVRICPGCSIPTVGRRTRPDAKLTTWNLFFTAIFFLRPAHMLARSLRGPPSPILRPRTANTPRFRDLWGPQAPVCSAALR